MSVIGRLRLHHQTALHMRFERSASLAEIAAALHVHRSRADQILRGAVSKVRGIEKYYYPTDPWAFRKSDKGDWTHQPGSSFLFQHPHGHGLDGEEHRYERIPMPESVVDALLRL